MRLSELIEDLQFQLAENGDMEVMTSSNYGDYHNTEQLDEIAEIIPCIPVESAYSHSGLAFPEAEEEDDFDERENDRLTKEQVLVLRYTSR